MSNLTSRQEEVVAYLRGHPWQTRQDAADALEISPHTLDKHMRAIYEAYDISGGQGQSKLRRLMQKLESK